MKSKFIIIALLTGMFLVSGFSAKAAERVYIRLFILGDIGRTEIVIEEKGEVTESEIGNPFSKHTESLKALSETLDKYFNQGFKLISSTTQDIANKGYTEYILEKN